MSKTIARRSFLKLSSLSMLSFGLGLNPDPVRSTSSVGLGRVSISWINVFSEPSFLSSRLAKFERDELITLNERIHADDGPNYNPIWYRIDHGFLHSGSIQPVQWHTQTPLSIIPVEGALFEVSVPYTRSYLEPRPDSRPLYRLYYQSTAWVTAVEVDETGRSWYQIDDAVIGRKYYTRAEHLRWIPAHEISPLSTDIPARLKHIVVSLKDQELRAYEDNHLCLRSRIASGIPDSTPQSNGIPTITPNGRFYVDKKLPVRHMGNGNLTNDLEAYELPGVPWVSFFHETGVAFHGTYWHNDFGRPRSHGCVNMRNEDALWLYRWTSPVIEAHQRVCMGYGTRVIVE